MVYTDLFLSHCCPVIHRRLMDELAMALVMLIPTLLMKVGTFYENPFAIYLCITSAGFALLGKLSVIQRKTAVMSKN